MIALPTKLVLTNALAKSMLAACEDNARTMSLAMTIPIVGDGGHLINFSRMDGVHVGTVELAISHSKSRSGTLRFTRIGFSANRERHMSIHGAPVAAGRLAARRNGRPARQVEKFASTCL